MVQKSLLKIILLFSLFFALFVSELFSNDLYLNARDAYYKATEKEEFVDKSIELFKKLEKDSDYKGLARTYIGSLIMLKGKYAFWPNQKLNYVDDGLKEMDKGLSLDPKNIESLFIYGSTCYYLPFFLGKKNLAISKLKKLVHELNDSSIERVDKKILKNALEFIQENIDLNEKDSKKVESFKNKL